MVVVGSMPAHIEVSIPRQDDHTIYASLHPGAVAPARGGKGGGCHPNVEKDSLRNPSKFDEKIEGGGGYPSQM